MSKNKKIILIILSIFIVLGLFLGVSYAYYIKSISQEESNVVKTKCLNFSLTNEKNDINLDEQYPIPDTEGRKLTPYQFTITNTCEQFISYNVNLEMLEGTTMDSSAVKVMINNEAPVNLSTLESTSVSIDTSKDSKILATGSLGSNDSVDYALRLWMDYGDTADTSSMNKVFESKVVVTATVGTYKPSDYVTTLHDAILVNEYGVTDVNNAINRIEAKGTPDLSQTAPIIKWTEKIGENTTRQVIKPSPATIKSDDATSDLSLDSYKMTICNKVSFNDDNAIYNMSDCHVVDPTEIDYSKDIKYYYADEYIAVYNTSKKLWNAVRNNEKVIYQIVGAVKKDTTATWNNVNYPAINYSLEVKPMNSIQFESDKSVKGIYKTEDDFGDTYYYRGNVSNNNIIFAGFKWKIIRINGDNSIRLIYSGSMKNNDNTNVISSYVFSSKHTSPAYSGYMYQNLNSSDIKTKIDEWYKANILGKNYDGYLSVNNGFCGDRSIYDNDGVSSTSNTYFGSYERFKNNTATFKCPNIENDLYTLNSSNIGNKALTYPVGIVTYDELVFAGIPGGASNSLSYISSSSNYWTMTPSYFSANDNQVFQWSNVSGETQNAWINSWYGVRPVINLKADVEISGGIGTVNDPYVIKTN